MGLVADQYDEFFFRSYSPEGVALTPPREYIGTPNAQSFLNFGADPADITETRATAGEVYTRRAAPMRVIYTPAEDAPVEHDLDDHRRNQVEFWETVFGAPAPIAPTTQVWQVKELFTAIGLIGFAMFLVAFARALVTTRAFAGLKLEAPREAAPASRSGHVWFWGGLVVSAISRA